MGWRVMTNKVNITQKFSLFEEAWGPAIVGEMNDSYIKLEKLRGEFDWQQHDHEDELILVIQGRMLMMFHERNVWLEAGEFLIVPRGVTYKRFVPEGECQVVLVEPKNMMFPTDVYQDKTIAGLEMMG